MSVSFRRASFGAATALVLAATVAGVLVSGSSGSVAATADEPAARTVTVSGSGQTSGTPDIVRLDLGVQRTGQDVNAALSATNDDIRKIKEVLAEHGVKDADIQTSQLSINQHYGPIQTYEGKGMPGTMAPMSEPMSEPAAPEPAVAPDAPVAAPAVDLPAKEDPAVLGTREGMSSVEPDVAMPPMPQGPNGYDVFQSLSVKLRNLDDAGATISDAAAAGGNATRINGVSFEFSNSDALVEDARELAFASAKEKAEQYARLAGGSLGDVVSASEGSGGGGFPYPMAAQDAGGSKAVPFYPGSQQVDVTTTVVWELR
jgi:uncharacterized protein YggE